MKITYYDAFMLTSAMNDIVIQELKIDSAMAVADFATKLQALMDGFEERRGDFIKIEDTEEREKQFHAFLSEEVELPDVRFGGLQDVKYKPTMVMLLKRLNLW